MSDFDMTRGYENPINRSGPSSLEQQAQDELLKNQSLWEKLQLPDYKWNNLTPDEAQAQSITEDPRNREMQSAYLEKLRGLSNTGFTDADQAMLLKNQLDSAQAARAGRESIANQAAQRGQSGSGLQYALQAQGAQDSATRAQQAGLGGIEASARQKALYNQAYGSGLNDVRNQDFRTNAANVDAINKFNLFNTGNQNQFKQANAQGNMDTHQANWNAQMQKLGGQTGQNANIAAMYGAQADAKRKQQQALLTGLGTLAGAGIGAYAGGAKGAQTGATIGNAAGNAYGGY